MNAIITTTAEKHRLAILGAVAAALCTWATSERHPWGTEWREYDDFGDRYNVAVVVDEIHVYTPGDTVPAVIPVADITPEQVTRELQNCGAINVVTGGAA